MTKIAESQGASAEVRFEEPVAVLANDAALLDSLLPSLRHAAGAGVRTDTLPEPISEDFAYLARDVPGLFVKLGILRPGQDPASAPANHAPDFDIDEAAMEVGVRAHALVAIGWLKSHR
ncbi:MAG: M20/M25/M40 family metallo-hydrolase [Sphingomonas sp.]